MFIASYNICTYSENHKSKIFTEEHTDTYTVYSGYRNTKSTYIYEENLRTKCIYNLYYCGKVNKFCQITDNLF